MFLACILRRGTERLAEVSFSSLDSKYSYIFVIPQSETENILQKRLQELGVQVEFETELCDFETNQDGVIASIKDKEGKISKETFSQVVGCDGMHSSVRDKNEISFDGSDHAEALSFADLTIHGDLDKNFASIAVAKNQDGVIFYDPSTKWKVAIDRQ